MYKTDLGENFQTSYSIIRAFYLFNGFTFAQRSYSRRDHVSKMSTFTFTDNHVTYFFSKSVFNVIVHISTVTSVVDFGIVEFGYHQNGLDFHGLPQSYDLLRILLYCRAR